jgi:hypothetical protein
MTPVQASISTLSNPEHVRERGAEIPQLLLTTCTRRAARASGLPGAHSKHGLLCQISVPGGLRRSIWKTRSEIRRLWQHSASLLASALRTFPIVVGTPLGAARDLGKRDQVQDAIELSVATTIERMTVRTAGARRKGAVPFVIANCALPRATPPARSAVSRRPLRLARNQYITHRPPVQVVFLRRLQMDLAPARPVGNSDRHGACGGRRKSSASSA